MNMCIFGTSENKKTGNITQTYSHPCTCPTRCPFKGSGCYAEAGTVLWQWRKTSNAEKAKNALCTPETLKEKISSMPTTKILRHNIAGDLATPGTSDINAELVKTLDKAYKGKTAYTYTHCSITERNTDIIKNSKMVISYSCETVDQVKQAVASGVPVVMAVHTMSKKNLVIDGIKFKQCPATVDPEHNIIQCSDCKKCTKRKRNYVIVFPVHGNNKDKATFLIDI